ncbi:hypothetical protein ENBRE01_1434 [Enteropsectra breve]|nr:hypothetical protein ENBRE01_1434 [Enteropsectra breve]
MLKKALVKFACHNKHALLRERESPPMKYKQFLKKSIESKLVGKNRRKVRYALPFALKCMACECFYDVSTRVNCFKETIKDELYCGVNICRFIIRCKICRSFFTLLTDPENGCYKIEAGCIAINLQKAASDSDLPSCDTGGLNNMKIQHINSTYAKATASERVYEDARKLESTDFKLLYEALANKITIQEMARRKFLEKTKK